MKKVLLVMSMVVLFSMGISVYAETDDMGAYQFPVIPGTDEWKELSTHDEMMEVCMIPDKFISDASTEALLKSVLENPMMMDFIYFDDPKEAYQTMKSVSGLRPLLNRDNCLEVMIYAYKTIEQPCEDDLDSRSFFLEPLYEFLFSCYEIENDVELSDELVNMIYSRVSDRMLSGEYSMNTCYYHREDLSAAVASAGSVWTPVNGVVYTPVGNPVGAVYSRSPELTSSEIQQYISQVISSYPNAQLIGNPTIKYNCHSFAWYNRSTANPYWINVYPSIYVSDGSYSSYNGVPSYGMVGVYSGGTHSCLFMGGSISDGFIARSKWGAAGLYQHSYLYSPYGNSVLFYKPN